MPTDEKLYEYPESTSIRHQRYCDVISHLYSMSYLNYRDNLEIVRKSHLLLF